MIVPHESERVETEEQLANHGGRRNNTNNRKIKDRRGGSR
jgi:hypothetical protein